MNVPLNRDDIYKIASEQNKIELAIYDANTQRSLEAARAANASGREAIKATTFINGGAAVAMLAFIGHLASIKADSITVMGFAEPLRWFVIGALLCVVASGVTYAGQCFWGLALKREFAKKEAEGKKDETSAGKEERKRVFWKRVATGVNWIVIALVTTGLFCFADGCYWAYQAFKAFK